MEDKLLDLTLLKINTAKNIPKWFVPIYKTLLNKNITIEDWNIIMDYISKLVSSSTFLEQAVENLTINGAIAIPVNEVHDMF